MTNLHVLAEGLQFPEGPVWLEDGSLLVMEIAAGRIARVFPDGRTTVFATPGGGPNGAALGPGGLLYVCNNGGFTWANLDGLLFPIGPAEDYVSGRIEVVDLASGAVEWLYSSCDGHRLCGPNDIVFDAHGGFYFSDLGKSRARDEDHGGVFYARADGSAIMPVVYPLGHPNGIGLSPDGRTLYVAQTHERCLLAFDIVSPGVVAPPSGLLPGRVVAGFGPRQLLDSMAVCADGTLVQATLIEGAGLASVDPLTGAIRLLETGDVMTTNVCFGGPDRMTAYATLSASGRLVSLPWDRPGLPLAHTGTAP
jgi:gluconolactonase